MSKPNAWSLLQRDNARPHVIAHRGASGTAPENTVAAYRRAVSMGAVAVETDVHLTRDGVIVTIHDKTLERTTDGAGRVDAHDWSEVQRLDAGSWFDESFAGEGVPDLDGYLQSLGDQAIPVIEMKGGADVEVRLAHRYADSNGGAFFFSFDAGKIARLKALVPKCPCLFLVPWTDEVVPCDLADVRRAVGMDMDAIGVDWQRVSASVVNEAHGLGLRVFVYTVNTRDAVDHCLACGVDGIISDVPDRAEAWLKGEEQ